jgi:hypothetical protein
MITDRSTVETIVQSCILQDFLESFAEKLKHPALSLSHSMTAIMFLKELKLKLKTGEIAVICDFSENYYYIQMKYRVFIGTMLRQLFIHLWLIIYKIK